MKWQADQRGAATLIVVMVMFLIVAMLAAYANRNLVFEQRVASNYVRNAIAHEAAEAGLEWALAKLNTGKIDAACQPSTSGASSFRQRYVGVDAASGAFTPLAIPTKDPVYVANCARAASGTWQCQCPAPTVVTVADINLPASIETQPSFGVGIERIPRSGVLRILAYGCNDRQTITCTNILGQAAANAMLLSNVHMRVEVALLSALKVPPAAPLTSRLSLTTDAQGVGLHNSDALSGGLLLISGDPLPAPSSLPEDKLDSLPGTPSSQAMFQDQALHDVSTDASTARSMFGHYFGMPSESYRLQPAIKRITCDGDCGQALLDAYAAGARMLWVNGPLTISSNIELGSDEEPMVLIAAGAVTLRGPMRLHGLLYARGDLAWNNPTTLPAQLNGAAIAEGHATLSGRVDFWYQSAVIGRLNKATGSFVRVPGSWDDAHQ